MHFALVFFIILNLPVYNQIEKLKKHTYRFQNDRQHDIVILNIIKNLFNPQDEQYKQNADFY